VRDQGGRAQATDLDAVLGDVGVVVGHGPALHVVERDHHAARRRGSHCRTDLGHVIRKHHSVVVEHQLGVIARHIREARRARRCEDAEGDDTIVDVVQRKLLAPRDLTQGTTPRTVEILRTSARQDAVGDGDETHLGGHRALGTAVALQGDLAHEREGRHLPLLDLGEVGALALEGFGLGGAREHAEVTEGWHRAIAKDALADRADEAANESGGTSVRAVIRISQKSGAARAHRQLIASHSPCSHRKLRFCSSSSEFSTSIIM